MYDHTLGRALNYGQSLQPGKAPMQPAQNSQSSFLDRQINTYGAPSQRRGGGQAAPPAAPQPANTVMPNGQPVAYQPPQQPQQPPAQPRAQQFQQGTAGSVNQEGVYTAGQAPQQTYQAQNIQQWQAPQQLQQLQNQQQGMVQQLLNNPYTMGEQQLAQMKGQTVDDAALLERQTMGQMRDALAARGLNVNSGYGLGQMRAIMGDTNANILNNNRALDLQASQQNRQDLLQALGVAGDFQNNAFGQSLQGYQAGLQGQGMQREENLAAQNAALQALGLNTSMLGQQSSSLLNAIQNRNQGQQIANQASQFGQSLGFDRDKFEYQKTLDDRQLGMQGASQSAANSRWEDEMAYKYQMAQQDEQWRILNFIMQGGDPAMLGM